MTRSPAIPVLLALILSACATGAGDGNQHRCGNGAIDPGETCDGTNFGAATCASLRFAGGDLACTGSCVLDTSACTAGPLCGDLTRDASEACDGEDLGGATCAAAGYGDGTVTCTAGCTLDYAQCSAPPECGNGLVETPAEACDDNGTATGDGCGADCQLEAGWSCDPGSEPSTCARIPEAPIIDGEPSAGHPMLTWTWTLPADTADFRIRLDGGAESTTVDRTFTSAALAEGDHLFEVAACNALGGCSAFAAFTTRLEYFGQANRPVWQGVAKPDLCTTAIGNVVPVSCHNCYAGPNNAVLGTTEALAKIQRALDRSADLIELDIASDGATLCVYHGDPASCDGMPGLAEILADPGLRAAPGLLFIEIKEGGTAPADFATALLDLLDANREVVRNGRPLFLRAFASGLPYLLALQAGLAGYPMIAPYVRFSVLYNQNAIADVAAFQSEIAATVAGNGFHMVELTYQQKHLIGLATYARSLGLGVGVWTIPGSFGEAFIAALREDVDELTAEYRIDQARAVVEAPNTHAYLNASACASAADATVTVHRNPGSGPETTLIPVNVAPTATAYGTPGLWYDAAGEDRFGCSLDFRSSAGMTQRAVNLGSHPPGANGGFLVMAYVNFDVLGSLTGTMALVNSAEAGGFALELFNDGTSTVLRFGVHVNGAYRYHAYDVSATGLAAPNASLNGTDGYLLVGAYDGDGGVYLWIDNTVSGNGGTYTGGVTASGQPTLGGADPQPADALGARFFFDGLIQVLGVQAWGDHAFAGSTVNE